MVENSKGSTVIYKQADLKYDSEKKSSYLPIDIQETQDQKHKPKNETTEDNHSSLMSLGENGRKKRKE